jgi:hypothetical protein
MPTPRSTHYTRVPGAAAGVGRGQRLREIVEVAVKRRKMLVMMGKCRMPEEIMGVARMRLEVWLERNPHAGALALAGFTLYNDVLIVMPANNEGKKLLLELDELLRN